MISGNNLAILTRAVPAEGRGRAIATITTGSAIAALAGAGLGTAAVALGGWQVLFLATVPLALWAALRSRRLPGSSAEFAHVSVDWPGAGLLVVAITLIAVALNHPHTTTNEVVMPVFHLWLPALAIIAVGAFIGVERGRAHPLMDWGQLRNRAFAAAVGVNGILHLTMMAGMFLGPILVVRGLGLDTTAGGMLMVGVQASVILTAFFGGWLYDRTHSRWIRPSAAAIVAIGLAAWAVAGQAGSYWGLMAAGLFAGLGNGVLLAVNNTVIMGTLPASARGVASGMLETTRHFGHAFGVTIPTAILAIVTYGAASGSEPAAMRYGFMLACLAMAALAGVGALLAALEPGERSFAD
jgi:MFS family permease